MNLRARWPHAQRLGHELKYRVYYVQEWALVVLLALSRYAGGQRKPFEWVSEFSSHSCFERSTQPWAPEGNPNFLPYFSSFFSSLFPNFTEIFLSLSPSFPISLWWVLHTPFRFPRVPFLSLSLRRPRFIHPSPQSSLFFPLSPPKSHGSLLSYPPISALSIHSPPPPKFFIAPFPSSLGLENKISPWGPRSYLSPPLNSLDSFPSPPSEPPIPSPFPSPFPSEFFNHPPQIP